MVWCAHCTTEFPNTDYSAWRDHVLKDHADNKLLVETALANDRWDD